MRAQPQRVNSDNEVLFYTHEMSTEEAFKKMKNTS